MKELVVGNAKSKTSWAMTAIGVLGILQDQGLVLIPPEYQGKALLLIGILGLILRQLTKDSITEKAQPEL